MVFMAIITAEALYPAPFDTTDNTISDLGATIPPNSVILQPSATIFDVSMIVAGLAIVAGAFFVHRAFARKAVTIPLALFGIGALGVGVFPGNHLAPHQLFAMTAFISGGVAAVLAAKVLVTPLRQLSVVIGVDLAGELPAGDVPAGVGPGRGARRRRHRAVDRVSGDPVAHHLRRRPDGH